MAAAGLARTTPNLLAVLLTMLSLCSLYSATPILPSTNLTTDPSADLTTTTTPPPLPITESPTNLPTPHESLDQLIRGVRVLRRHGFNQMLLGELYDSSNATLERGFYVFSVLMQSLHTIQLLEGNNMASDNLAIFKVILNGVLNDTCQWFKSHDPTLDCSDRTHFLTIVLSMGLRPHLNNLECFLTGMDRFTGDQSLDPWVARTFVAEPVLGCQVCSTQNLQSCSNCS